VLVNGEEEDGEEDGEMLPSGGALALLSFYNNKDSINKRNTPQERKRERE
jgi:hypothetical protein